MQPLDAQLPPWDHHDLSRCRPPDESSVMTRREVTDQARPTHCPSSAVESLASTPVSDGASIPQQGSSKVPSTTEAVPVFRRRGLLRYSDQVLSYAAQTSSTRSPLTVGWDVLGEAWGINPGDLDKRVCETIKELTVVQMNNSLLDLAASNLEEIRNLSAYLSCIIQEHKRSDHVCVLFLIGLCESSRQCGAVHPADTPGWNALLTRWNVSYREIDFAAITSICKHTFEVREGILHHFAGLNIGAIPNISSSLSKLISGYKKNC